MKALSPIDCLFTPQISGTPGSSPLSPPFPGVPCLARTADLVGEMRVHGVERALLTPCQVEPTKCGRQYLCDEALLSEFRLLVHHYPQSFFALAGYNPYDIGGSLRRINEAVLQRAVRGVYVSGVTLPLLDRRMYPAYANCAELGVPLMVHADHGLGWVEGWPMLEEVNTIATDFPELRVIAACLCWPDVSEARRLMERLDNVHLAVNANPRRDLVDEVANFLNSDLGRSRCLWGSNGCGWDVALAKLHELKLSDETRTRFARQNAIEVFGLDRQETPQLEINHVLTAE